MSDYEKQFDCTVYGSELELVTEGLPEGVASMHRRKMCGECGGCLLYYLTREEHSARMREEYPHLFTEKDA